MGKHPWHHAPIHKFIPGAAHMITGSTLYKRHFYRDAERLTLLQTLLLQTLEEFEWEVHAWAVFSNHYHFVAVAPDDSRGHEPMIGKLHACASRELNRLDNVTGRRNWYQAWDTALTYSESYYARLNYVHHNPVHHGLVKDARNYRWCSAAWFYDEAPSAYRRKILSFACDRTTVIDDFEVEPI